MKTEILDSFVKLKEYCEKEEYKGWDAYDGLNSKVFQALPFLKHSAICRLVMIQGFKRFPFNLRRLAMVLKGVQCQGYWSLSEWILQSLSGSKQSSGMERACRF